jgi:hypothetical protein
MLMALRAGQRQDVLRDAPTPDPVTPEMAAALSGLAGATADAPRAENTASLRKTLALRLRREVVDKKATS